jgi:serine phosphatase RsbU (regulator of sigma subunit)
MFPDSVHPSSYFIPRFYLIGVSIIPLLVFNLKESRLLLPAMAVNFFLILGYNTVHKLFNADPNSMGQPIAQEEFISISAAFAMAIITAGCLFLIRLNSFYENRITKLLQDSEEKNLKIQDSIRYALRLQSAIFPPKSVLSDHTEELFLYYKPKDIVSGDFYIFIEKPDSIMLAIVDCTGHGVPGAFMSIIANNAIRRAINEIALIHPKDIILQAAEFIKFEFENNPDFSIYDGMDISFCCVDKVNKKIHFAGANQTLYLVRQSELFSFKGSKNALGIKFQMEEGIEEIEIGYHKNDHIYMTSDGFQDQFGGENDKKFGRKRLEATFKAISKLPMIEQGLELERQMNEWKIHTEQTDDMCVIGYKLT